MLSLLKAQKSNHYSASNRWKYTKSCFKENGKKFFKNSTNQGNIIISRLKKRIRKLYKKKKKKKKNKKKKKKKKKFKPEIKSIIKNLQDELYQLENKQAKGAKLRAKVK